jgi:FtsP/CotA-like multicopper oxidase with cupredoxin domain
VKQILFGPGERLDVLVDFSNTPVGSSVHLISKTFDLGGDAQGKQEFKIMKFSVTSLVSDPLVVPATLSNIPDIPSSSAVTTRTFQISNPMERYGYPMNDGMRMRHRINGKLFDSKRIDEMVSANTNEIWVFYNDKGDEPHPMHLHGVFFRVLQRDGGRGALTVAEQGWKDTVLVMPGEIVKILVPFESNRGKFVFHCHNLEHEDDGMMLQYQVN